MECSSLHQSADGVTRDQMAEKAVQRDAWPNI